MTLLIFIVLIVLIAVQIVFARSSIVNKKTYHLVVVCKVLGAVTLIAASFLTDVPRKAFIVLGVMYVAGLVVYYFLAMSKKTHQSPR